jgi:hypothetical protein
MKFFSVLVLAAGWAAGAEELPSVYTIVEDDYPYQCVCKCDDNTKVISVCEYDKTTLCYCDVNN